MKISNVPKQFEIHRLAKLLPKDERKDIIRRFKETELHRHLKELFKAMEPNYTIEITHGTQELGKDLVIVKKDKFGFDVIGVIVKKADITGKTLGSVDDLRIRIREVFNVKNEKKLSEIESQIEQALAHKAELKSVYDSLPVSKIFIILAGDISNQAKIRLRGEAGDTIDIFDINWLIDKFTEHYPQAFFEGSVLDFLHDKINKLESKHWLSKKGMSLSEYFIDPPLLAADVPVKFDEDGLALILNKRKIPFLQIKSALINCKKIILVGDPGVGKSAALSKFTIEMLKEAYISATKRKQKGKKIGIPILIPAKELLELATSTSLLDYYFEGIDIKDRFQIQTILVDALDEAPPNLRKEIIQKAELFSKELLSCLVITSRKIEVIDSPPIGFEKYEVLPFEFKQALKLFEKLALNKKTLSALRDGLEKIKHQIPMVPLSLMLLLELVEDQKEIPASVTELYDRYFDIDLGRYDKEKGIEVLFEYLVKKNLLAELACNEFFHKDRLEIPLEDFNEFLNNYAARYNWDRNLIESLVREIERSGIIDIKEIVLFRHRSFLDYFAAYHIFDKREEFKNLNEKIVEIYFDDIWENIAFFYIGLRREMSSAMLENIFATEGQNISFLINKFSIGRLFQAGWHSESKIKDEGIKKAISIAPRLKDRILSIMQTSKVKVPKIYGDFLLMAFSEFSFGSIFLKNEITEIVNDLIRQGTYKDIYAALILLSPIYRFLEPNDLNEITTNLLDKLSGVTVLDNEQRGILLILFMIMEKNDPTVQKAIKKRLDKLMKLDPSTFKKLLPPKKKGYRLKHKNQ